MATKKHPDAIVTLALRLEEQLNPDAQFAQPLRETLIPRQKRMLVIFYRTEMAGNSNRRIGEIIGLSESRVSHIWRKYVMDSAWQIDDLDVRGVAADFTVKKDVLFQKAMANRDFDLAWRIVTQYIDKMADLGYIRREPLKVLTGHFDLRQMARDYFKDAESLSPAEFFERLKQAEGIDGNGKKPTPLLVAPPSAPPGGERRGGGSDAGTGA